MADKAGMNLLLFALFLSPTADAWNKAEEQRRGDVGSHLSSIAAKVDSEMPPCPGLRLLREEAARYAPPAGCREARAFYDRVDGYHTLVAQNCEEMTRFMEAKMHSTDHCHEGEPDERSLREMSHLQRNARAPFDPQDWEKERHKLEDIAENGGPGEYRRADCALALETAARARYRTAMILGKAYGISNYALSESCGASREETKADYLRFLERGEQ